MSQYLLDTNVVSELRKGSRCDRNVARWHSTLERDSTWLSVLVLAEIRRGIEILRVKYPIQSAHLERWLEGLKNGFASRILPVDARIADRWGIINAKSRISYVDGFLAATALEHDIVLATRNTSDISISGVKHVNPFSFYR